MMAEMPPSGGPPQMTQTTVTTRRGVNVSMRFLTSIGGILTIVAWVCSFCGMISIEVQKSKTDGWTLIPELVFHEFVLVTSWLFHLIFIVVCALSLQTLAGMQGTTVTFFMIGRSALWFLFALISSSLVASLTGMSKHKALESSVAFGFLESFALLGVVIVSVMNLMGMLNSSSFD